MIIKLINKISKISISLALTTASLNAYSQTFSGGELINEQGFG